MTSSITNIESYKPYDWWSNLLKPVAFYWNASTLPGKCTVMYMSVISSLQLMFVVCMSVYKQNLLYFYFCICVNTIFVVCILVFVYLCYRIGLYICVIVSVCISVLSYRICLCFYNISIHFFGIVLTTCYFFFFFFVINF